MNHEEAVRHVADELAAAGAEVTTRYDEGFPLVTQGDPEAEVFWVIAVVYPDEAIQYQFILPVWRRKAKMPASERVREALRDHPMPVEDAEGQYEQWTTDREAFSPHALKDWATAHSN